MPEIGTSGSMSGDAKRSVGHRPQGTAPILDSTRRGRDMGDKRLLCPDIRCFDDWCSTHALVNLTLGENEAANAVGGGLKKPAKPQQCRHAKKSPAPS